MDTILRRLILNDCTDIYYCFISHDLEKFSYVFKSENELIKSGTNLNATYKVNSGIKLPAYVGDMLIDDVTKSILKSKFRIRDSGNLFSEVYSLFKYTDLIKFFEDHSDYRWVFDSKSISMANESESIDIINPSKYWSSQRDDDFNRRRILYNGCDSINRLFESGLDNGCTLVKDLNEYTYPVFHTVLIDMCVYIEYCILEIEILNDIANRFSNDKRENVFTLTTLIERNTLNETPGIRTKEFLGELSDCNSLTSLKKLLHDNTHKSLANYYKMILKQVEFFNDTAFVYDSFVEYYKTSLLKYIEAAIMFIRWDFIKSMVGIPAGFTGVNTEMNTPVGTLLINGGDLRWE